MNWIKKMYKDNPDLLGEILAIVIFWVIPIIGIVLIMVLL